MISLIVFAISTSTFLERAKLVRQAPSKPLPATRRVNPALRILMPTAIVVSHAQQIHNLSRKVHLSQPASAILDIPAALPQPLTHVQPVWPEHGKAP